MKTRLSLITVSGLFGLCLSAAHAFLPPKAEPLGNFDQRTASATSAAAALRSGNAGASGAAEEALRARVPEVRVSRDRILGTPSWVSTRTGFLTGPNGSGGISEARLAAIPSADPHRVVKGFIDEHSALFGHDSRALDSARVTRDSISQHNGLRTTVWEQMVDGIPVFESLVVGHVTRAGELVNISSRFVPNPGQAASRGTPNRTAMLSKPSITPAQAIVRAARNLNVELPESAVAFDQAAEGAERAQKAAVEGLMGPAAVQLAWLPINADSMRLCWRVVVGTREPMGHFMLLVDAENGEVLVRRSLTEHIGPASYRVYTSDSPSPLTPGHPAPSIEQPTNVNRVLVTLPALDTNASPAGWINDGERSTSGNNAIAFRDRDFSLSADVPLPQGAGPERVFDYPLNLAQAPLSYASAATVQLFYSANVFHDRLYQLGFTEAAGNFQLDNFGRGGLGDDQIICLVQAGADVGYSDNAFFSTLPDGMNGICAMFVFQGPNPDRDGSLDQEVVMHEMAHGLSNRLLGGGPGISALQSRGMGEGWSDFYALSLLSEPTDPVDGVYPSGGYASYRLAGFDFEENYYFGIRRYPYSTDMSINPLTFKDIDPTRASSHLGVPINPVFGGGDPSEVHNQGEVWCMVLREVWANIVSKSGWDIGNELTMQLVTDGLKLAPANATFLEARDAILKADLVNTGGDNYVEIWLAFAKRGMGYSAVCPPSDTTIGVLESFDLPPDLGNSDGILEVRVTPPAFDAMFAGETNSIFVRVSDALPLTNATVSATLSTGGGLNFRNDGVAPDQLSNNGVYSASLIVPTNVSSFTMTIVSMAPEKDPATNVVTYLVVPIPSNDNFANATKAPASGTNYLTNNKRATLQPDEPEHANIPTQTGSLWWDYTPTVNTNVLVDTGGSAVRTVVAIYTNNTLAGLKPIASAGGSITRFGAFTNFSARAGVTYHIAVSGYDSRNVGTLQVAIAPGLQADTSAPVVTIVSPVSGVVVNSNRLVVAGTASDTGVNFSGIREINVNVAPVGSFQPPTSFTLPASALGPSNTNWTTIVGLSPGLNRIQASAVDFAGNQSPVTSVLVHYRPIDPVNDFFVNALVLTNAAGTNLVNTANATKQAGEPNHAGVVGGKSVWWRFTAPADGLLTLSTEGSTFDTVMGLYTGPQVNQLTTISSNDDAFPGAANGYSSLSRVVRSNDTYRIAIDGYDSQSGAVFLTHVFTAGPVFRVTADNAGGGAVNPPVVDAVSNTPVVLTAVANAGYEFDHWDGAVLSLNNPLLLTVTSDMTVVAHFREIPFTDGFESGNLLHLSWMPGGDKPWIVQSGSVSLGQYAARSGNITHSQSSSLILSGNFRAGTASFDRRVSSEPGFDALRFYVDGAQQQQWSGEVPWGPHSFSLTAGAHTLEWRYSKDPNGTSGLDAAFIDNVNVPLIVPVDSSTPANLALKVQSDGGFFIEFSGQSGQQYILQSSTNLLNWENVSTNVVTGDTGRFLNLPTNSGETRFYRALAWPF